MKWTYAGLVACLSFSGASASVNSLLRAKYNLLSSDIITEIRHNQLLETIEKQRNHTTPNPHDLTKFLTRRQAGRCGAEYGGQRCPDQQCCSTYGFCGNEFEFCGEIVGCQPQYGRCGNAPVQPPSSTPTPSSSTPTPTPTSSSSSTPVIPTSSSTPVVPSSSSSSSSSAPLPSGTLIVSTNGQCGNVTTCAGSGFGGCCSEWYFCGSAAAYCGVGCRSAFGNCGQGPPVSSSSLPPISSSSSAPPSSSSPSSTPTPTPTSTPTPTPSSSSIRSSSTAAPVPTNVSTDGRCGENGKTCTGSASGTCCSDYGWCGSGDDYCQPAYGCQPQWGVCGSGL